MQKFDGRAYAEVYEIINMLSEKEKAKIPEKWYQLIETNRDKDYEFDARSEGAVLLPDTEKILSVIYTDYLATEYERKIIKAKENSFIHKKNNHKKNNIELSNKETELKGKLDKTMIEYNDGFWNNIVSRIKNFFRLK